MASELDLEMQKIQFKFGNVTDWNWNCSRLELDLEF